MVKLVKKHTSIQYCFLFSRDGWITFPNTKMQTSNAFNQIKPLSKIKQESLQKKNLLTISPGVDDQRTADQACIQTPTLVHQTCDTGLIRGEEMLQTNLLRPLAALIHRYTEK